VAQPAGGRQWTRHQLAAFELRRGRPALQHDDAEAGLHHLDERL
jgi:hypothetical protein